MCLHSFFNDFPRRSAYLIPIHRHASRRRSKPSSQRAVTPVPCYGERAEGCRHRSVFIKILSAVEGGASELVAGFFRRVYTAACVFTNRRIARYIYLQNI